MEGTLKRIKEAWENILMEMDTKLARWASEFAIESKLD
jgi:hypothetical protein